jgi:CRP/FNR family transcriptional regulator, cyclic AMP receptor protein
LPDAEKALLENLQAVPLFSGLKDKDLKVILKSGKRQSYPEGKLIVAEGEVGVAFYLILDGKVEVRRKGKVIAKLGGGNFFGEMSLFDRSPRSSDVVAVAPTDCLQLSSWSFQGVVEANGAIALNMLKTLSQRLRDTNSALTD